MCSAILRSLICGPLRQHQPPLSPHRPERRKPRPPSRSFEHGCTARSRERGTESRVWSFPGGIGARIRMRHHPYPPRGVTETRFNPLCNDEACLCCRVSARRPRVLLFLASQPPRASRPPGLAGCMRLSTTRAWKAAHEWSERFPRIREWSGSPARRTQGKARRPLDARGWRDRAEQAHRGGRREHACKLGCEGIVSKQRASSYRSADQGVARSRTRRARR